MIYTSILVFFTTFCILYYTKRGIKMPVCMARKGISELRINYAQVRVHVEKIKLKTVNRKPPKTAPFN